MNGFRRLQERLREEGWYVGWNLPCCQSCAWSELPYEFEDGTEIDFSKVLFNHSQDCEVEPEPPEGLTEEQEEEWWEEWEERNEGFQTLSPEEQHYSMFCFDGGRKGVKNLKAILPIIEECGCSWHWNETGKQRIEISWDNK